MAANDRAAAPGKSGGSAGSDGLMRASLSAVAPGTPLRDGLERVLRGNTGDTPLTGGDIEVVRVADKGIVVGKVKLSVDQLSANPRVKLSAP